MITVVFQATVAGDLEAHIRDSAMHREMKLAALKEKLSKTEMGRQEPLS